jgi:hypothetical protein
MEEKNLNWKAIGFFIVSIGLLSIGYLFQRIGLILFGLELFLIGYSEINSKVTITDVIYYRLPLLRLFRAKIIELILATWGLYKNLYLADQDRGIVLLNVWTVLKSIPAGTKELIIGADYLICLAVLARILISITAKKPAPRQSHKLTRMRK